MKIDHKYGPSFGNALGKGLYFADTFDKAYSYAHNEAYHQQKKASKLVLICEVAAGK